VNRDLHQPSRLRWLNYGYTVSVTQSKRVLISHYTQQLITKYIRLPSCFISAEWLISRLCGYHVWFWQLVTRSSPRVTILRTSACREDIAYRVQSKIEAWPVQILHSLQWTMRSWTAKNWRTPAILSSASCRLWYECYHDKQNFSWLNLSEFIFRKIETSLAFLILDISALTSRHCQVRIIITLDAWILRWRSSNPRITVCHAVPMGPTKERKKKEKKKTRKIINTAFSHFCSALLLYWKHMLR